MQSFTLKTKATCVFSYLVGADSVEQAESRLRSHLADPRSLAPGIVTRDLVEFATKERLIATKEQDAPAQPDDFIPEPAPLGDPGLDPLNELAPASDPGVAVQWVAASA